jgi:hypothetical protein
VTLVKSSVVSFVCCFRQARKLTLRYISLQK